MAQLITVRLNKADHQPLGFRLQGGKDFGTPLVVQKVNGGSAAERAGLQAGDALIRVNTTDVYSLRHQEAQDAIRAAGINLELTVQRGGGTWRPTITPTGSLPRPGSRPIGGSPALVTNTSLKATPQPSRAFGSGHNNVAKPFGYMNGNDAVKNIVNKQYNTPVNMYSDKTIAETLSAQTEVLAGGVLGVNFKKNEKTYDAEKSAVFKVLQEEQNDPEPVEVPHQGGTPTATTPVSGLRHVQAPVTRPDAPINNTGGLPPGQNICEECERLITGVFVRIKDKNLHVECFKCSTCGTSLKNQGYYNLNGKLYCDIHAKLVARQNPPAPNLDPVTVPPGNRIPTNTYSTPLPPLATNNYTNGSSSLFSPSSNLSGPKPFGSSIGSAYSPSLSPRSAPLSPARPVTAPVAAAPIAPAPIAAPQPPAPFVPTQNVKSVVWPPPQISSDNELQESSLISTEPMCANDSLTQSVKKEYSDSQTKIANVQQQSVEQFIHSANQNENVSSSMSYSSASMSSMATSKCESIVKNNQMMQETSSRTVQSFAQESSKSKSSTVYQSQTNVLPQKEILNLINNNESVNKVTAGYEDNLINPSINQNDDKSEIQQQSIIGKEEESMIINENKTINTTEQQETCKVVEQTKISIQPQSVTTIKLPEPENVSVNTACALENKNRFTEKNYESAQISIDQNLEANANRSRDPSVSMVDALTIAPDRPYSPLPTAQRPISNIGQSSLEQTDNTSQKVTNSVQNNIIQLSNTQLPTQQSPLFLQEPKRGTTPIPPIKAYNPPEKNTSPLPMPEETQPYIPPDFKINIEPKNRRDIIPSPMVDALTTAPNRPFTPTIIHNQSIERGSLRDALTIAPDRPFSPLGFISTTQSSQYMTSSVSHVTETNTLDIIKPIATQTTTKITDKIHSELSAMQNTCQLQSSAEMSAFKPVAKQIFSTSKPDNFCKLTNFPPVTNELKTSFSEANKTRQESKYSESTMMQHSAITTTMASQGYSSVKSAQNYFEQLDKKESLTSTATRSKSGLHKPDSIPPYQKNFEQLPSQRGITPELYNAPAVLQRPVTPSSNLPSKSKERSLEPNPIQITTNTPKSKIPQLKTPVPQAQPVRFQKDTPITMTFQPVADANLLRVSPSRSRPTSPSLINKPAPIIPHYQMNLLTVEHMAPESHLYEPSSREASRSPTPKPRSHSPAQGPPPNPLKAHAPRIKNYTPQNYSSDSILSHDYTNVNKKHEIDKNGGQCVAELYNSNWNQNQPAIIKEQNYSNMGYKAENYAKGDMTFKEDSLNKQNYGQRQMVSQNVVEQGNTTMHTTRKTYEEYESTQSAKVIEIRKGGSLLGIVNDQIDSNSQGSNINPKQVFPPPLVSVPPTEQSSSFNIINQNVASAIRANGIYESTKPPISGANPGPVCDPTPSTGSSVGAAARGKTFGVSSAPKRGRGVLNKPALPGSRVPLCASCNGNIRGPFITALGRIWCPEHFICVNATCRRPLQDIGFVEENGQLYCEFCFEQYIAPACDKCHAKIKGDCLNAIGKHYHPECFNCVYCGKLFGNNPFFLEDGLPYCEADWNDLFTTKCFACGFPVEAGDRWVEALNNNYHSQCFNCTVCKKNLEGQSFFAKGGRPFCKTHAR